jgi:hypothetical protein
LAELATVEGPHATIAARVGRLRRAAWLWRAALWLVPLLLGGVGSVTGRLRAPVVGEPQVELRDAPKPPPPPLPDVSGIDPTAAYRAQRKICLLGNGEACLLVASKLETADGIAHHPELAARLAAEECLMRQSAAGCEWLRKACREGNEKACHFEIYSRR